ncbi:MAG: hypothetical protein WD875_09575 [Pirellulales bacterium]
MHFPALLAAGGLIDQATFLSGVKGFLTLYYLSLALLNAVAAFLLWHHWHRPKAAVVWMVFSAVVLAGYFAPMAGSGDPGLTPRMPEAVVNFLNSWLSGQVGAIVYTVGSVVFFCTIFVARDYFVRPMVAWTCLNLALVAMGLSMVNQNFWHVVSKGDNIPIIGLMFLLGFFTWLATHRAVINDKRIAEGLPPLEKLDDEKVLVWPDLVYTELVCMLALTAFLIIWAILIQAPLEQPASPVKTPNPSKAPWYFLGLQEMLVYFDPWMAGVVAPSLIVVGLMAIPYLDFNKKGMGYYTINERKFAYLNFQFGFLVLWVTLIVMGTVLRGPNWNFFGPFEPWDAHKVEALKNVDLSEYFWIGLLNRGLPKAAPESTFLSYRFPVELAYILLREAPGFILMSIYLFVVPPALAIGTSLFRGMYLKMGFIRYMLLTNLLLMMAILPIKMALRWSFNLKYIIHIDEWFLNF